MADNTDDLLSRLREPLWSHGNFAFDSPQLAKDETVADLKAAADEIEQLRATVATLANLPRGESHVHYHVPNGSVLKAVGDVITIEPWFQEVRGSDGLSGDSDLG